MRARVIPCLLLNNGGLVKTTKFRNPSYVGDPINAVRVFNRMEVDELAILDISATPSHRGPDIETIHGIVEEAFMPVAYGGGITNVEQAERMIEIGLEKVVVNTGAMSDPGLVSALAQNLGSQSVVVAVDARRRTFGGWDAMMTNGSHKTGRDPIVASREMRDAGAGEILLTSVDRDGTRAGYDLKLIEGVCAAVDIPVIACGGAGKLSDFADAIHAGATAVAAGSLFVHHGHRRAVLISYPTPEEIAQVLFS